MPQKPTPARDPDQQRLQLVVKNDRRIERLIRAGRLTVNAEEGLVYSKASNTPDKPIGSTSRKGYLRTQVTFGGKSRPVTVHRAVWISVNGVPPIGMQINHKDGVKTNNRIDNLELATNLENMQHAKENGLLRHLSGEEHYAARLNKQDVEAIYLAASRNEPTKDIAVRFGVCLKHVRAIVRGLVWKAGRQPLPRPSQRAIGPEHFRALGNLMGGDWRLPKAIVSDTRGSGSYVLKSLVRFGWVERQHRDGGNHLSNYVYRITVIGAECYRTNADRTRGERPEMEARS